MNQTDLIILAVYLVFIVYVLRQAWNSIEERTVIKHVGNSFDYEGLKDFVDVNFKFDGYYSFDKQPSKLATTIVNKSPTATIIVDWEKGSLRTWQGGDRRLIRLIDGMQEGDKAKVQASSTISPKRSLSVTLTSEDLLTVDKETSELRPTKPMVDIRKLQADKDAKPKDKKDSERIQKLRDIYANFTSRREPLKFSMRLPLQITNIIEGTKKDMWGFIDCNFTVSYIPRISQVPWNPK
ncbi:MAG: hypothetical protein IGS54_12810 [Elainella sp. C42_A2020_010]|nr:hypothetical protein [Elainella sp. C42_A2020_010]